MPASPSADSSTDPADRLRTVHVRFAPSQGPRLRRDEPTTCGDGSPLWAERPLLMKRADGTYDLIGTTARLDGLARWILSHGSHAEVTSPERLRQQVAAEAHKIWRQYADG